MDNEFTYKMSANTAISVHDMLLCYMDDLAKKNHWDYNTMYNFPDYMHCIDLINKIAEDTGLEKIEVDE